MFPKITLNKTCIICGAPFVAHHKKALYCEKRSCKREGNKKRKVLNAKLSLQYAYENHLLMRKMDYIIQMLALVTGIPTPFGLIPKKNEVDLSHYDKDLEKLFKTEKKRIGNRLDKLKEVTSSKKGISPLLTKEIIKEREIIEKENKVSINESELLVSLKKIATETIKKNTGKFPILTPLEVGKIGKIIQAIVLKLKDKADVGNKDVIDYFTNAIIDIKTMPSEKYFD